MIVKQHRGGRAFSALLSSLMTIPMLLLSSPTVAAQSTTQLCHLSLAIADGESDRNDLLSKDEYVSFVSRFSSNNNNNSPAVGSFDALPMPLRDSFSNLARINGQINIFGSKPGQANDASEEQVLFLQQVCSDTANVINDVGFVPTVAPVSLIAVGDSTLRPTRPLNECFVGIVVNDVDPQDAVLEEEEYAGFVNFLASGAFDGLTYVQLPLTLQSNFANLAADDSNNDGGIDVAGLRNPDQDQFDYIETICFVTNTAIRIALRDSGEPTVFPTTLPSITASPSSPTRAPIMAALDSLVPSIVGGPTTFPTTEPSTLPGTTTLSATEPSMLPTTFPSFVSNNNNTLAPTTPVTAAPASPSINSTLAPFSTQAPEPPSPSTSGAASFMAPVESGVTWSWLSLLGVWLVQVGVS